MKSHEECAVLVKNEHLLSWHFDDNTKFRTICIIYVEYHHEKGEDILTALVLFITNESDNNKLKHGMFNLFEALQPFENYNLIIYRSQAILAFEVKSSNCSWVSAKGQRCNLRKSI